MIYHGKPVEPHTASHAVSYLREAKIWLNAHGATTPRALREVTKTIPPCRAVGVAKSALAQCRDSITGAIALLEAA